MKNIHAQALGYIKSKKKSEASRENGKKGGRPKKPKEIPLTQGKVALVDAEDYEELIKHKWYAQKSAGTFYAMRALPRAPITREQKRTSMHLQIMNTPKGMQTDHINGHGLDNRRCNLRICTTKENQWNTKKQCNNTSGFKGVSLDKSAKKEKWRAFINVSGKSINLGYHNTAEEAYKAYCEACVKYHGEFANFG